MTHPRTDLREGVRAQLASWPAIVSAGITVYKSRHVPVRPDRLPAINVHIVSDETDESSQERAPRELARDATVLIDCISNKVGTQEDPSDSSLDDELDLMCEMVEDAIAADDTIGDLIEDSLLSGAEFTYEADGDRVTGTATNRYVMEYSQNLPKTTDGLDDFNDAEVQFSLGNEQAEADRAVDSLTNLHE